MSWFTTNLCTISRFILFYIYTFCYRRIKWKNLLFTTKRKIVLPHEIKLPFAKRYLLRELQPPPMASVARVYIILPFPRVSPSSILKQFGEYIWRISANVFSIYMREQIAFLEAAVVAVGAVKRLPQARCWLATLELLVQK